VTVIPFSHTLRERARAGSGRGTTAGEAFMADLMSGRGCRDDYVSIVAQHWFVYQALEQAAERMAADDCAGCFVTPVLTRLPAIEADLAFLIGPDWRDRIAPLPVTLRYVARIHAASTWSGGFVAHHYTRYLGDLSGAQVIRAIVQREYGFETNGVGFYLFAGIARPREFKTTYREQLDAVAWTEEERARVVDEVIVAHRLSTELFDEIAASRVAA